MRALALFVQQERWPDTRDRVPENRSEVGRTRPWQMPVAVRFQLLGQQEESVAELLAAERRLLWEATSMAETEIEENGVRRFPLRRITPSGLTSRWRMGGPDRGAAGRCPRGP